MIYTETMKSTCSYRHMFFCVTALLLLTLTCSSTVSGFGIPASTRMKHTISHQVCFSSVSDSDDTTSDDPSDIVAKRIIVSGSSVQGGYYRACVLNEVCSD
jgi:hypothetical protein